MTTPLKTKASILVEWFQLNGNEPQYKEFFAYIIEEHLSLNYLDHIQDAESEVDQCKVKFEFGSEED